MTKTRRSADDQEQENPAQKRKTDEIIKYYYFFDEWGNVNHTLRGKLVESSILAAGVEEKESKSFVKINDKDIQILTERDYLEKYKYFKFAGYVRDLKLRVNSEGEKIAPDLPTYRNTKYPEEDVGGRQRYIITNGNIKPIYPVRNKQHKINLKSIKVPENSFFYLKDVDNESLNCVSSEKFKINYKNKFYVVKDSFLSDECIKKITINKENQGEEVIIIEHLGNINIKNQDGIKVDDQQIIIKIKPHLNNILERIITKKVLERRRNPNQLQENSDLENFIEQNNKSKNKNISKIEHKIRKMQNDAKNKKEENSKNSSTPNKIQYDLNAQGKNNFSQFRYDHGNSNIMQNCTLNFMPGDQYYQPGGIDPNIYSHSQYRISNVNRNYAQNYMLGYQGNIGPNINTPWQPQYGNQNYPIPEIQYAPYLPANINMNQQFQLLNNHNQPLQIQQTINITSNIVPPLPQYSNVIAPPRRGVSQFSVFQRSQRVQVPLPEFDPYAPDTEFQHHMIPSNRNNGPWR